MAKNKVAQISSHVNRCGECIHHKCGPAHSHKDDLCERLGVRTYALAPAKCFHADASQIPKADLDLHALGGILRHLSASQLGIIGHVITSAGELFKHDLQFGQTVYINLGMDPYLTSYFKGYAFGVTTIGAQEYVLVSARSLGLDRTEDADEDDPFIMLRLLPDSLLTRTAFKKLSADLIKRDRIHPPRRQGVPGWKLPLGEALFHGETLLEPPLEVVDGAVPTLDNAPVDWLEPNRVADVDILRGKVAKTGRKAPPVVKLKKQTKIVDGMTVTVVDATGGDDKPKTVKIKRTR